MGRFECLECTVDGRRVLVPMESLERVAELPLTPPPPLAQPWVRGFGLLGDRPLPAISLTPVAALPAAARTLGKALLLRSGADEPFALLVDDVRAIWSVNPEVFVGVADPQWPVPTRWLTSAQDGEDRVFCLQTEAVAEDLFGPTAPAPGAVS